MPKNTGRGSSNTRPGHLYPGWEFNSPILREGWMRRLLGVGLRGLTPAPA